MPSMGSQSWTQLRNWTDIGVVHSSPKTTKVLTSSLSWTLSLLASVTPKPLYPASIFLLSSKSKFPTVWISYKHLTINMFKTKLITFPIISLILFPISINCTIIITIHPVTQSGCIWFKNYHYHPINQVPWTLFPKFFIFIPTVTVFMWIPHHLSPEILQLSPNWPLYYFNPSDLYPPQLTNHLSKI